MEPLEEAKAYHEVEKNPIFQHALQLLREVEPQLKGNWHYKVVSFLQRYDNR